MIKFSEIEISPAVAYQMGRVDALDGSAPNRFTGIPTVLKSVKSGEWACSPNEAKAIEKIRAQYLAGYKSTEAEQSKIELGTRSCPTKLIQKIQSEI